MKAMTQDYYKIFAEHPYLKAVVACIAVMISWVFNGEYQAVMAILILRILDFATGTYYALKTPGPDHSIWGSWESKKSTEGMFKTGRYLLLMVVARLVDKATPVKGFSVVIDSYIAVTEAGSILENFKKLGYDVPSVLLDKINNFKNKK